VQFDSLGRDPELIVNHTVITSESETWQHNILCNTDQPALFVPFAVTAIPPAMVTATDESMERCICVAASQ
jgi:hypothetical protein